MLGTKNKIPVSWLWQIRLFCLLVAAIYLFVNIFSSIALAEVSKDQKEIYNKNIKRFDFGCSDYEGDVSGVSAGNGAPDGTAFPKLNPGAMAQGIDEYIKKTNPDSKMKNLGEKIVASGKNSDINPFLIVAIAQKESGLSSPNDFNVKNGNNSFGRTATSSQPNFQGSRTWYKWSSVEASVDHTADENKNKKDGDIAGYIRNSGFYDNALRSNSLAEMMTTYAPPFENDTSQYVRDIKSWTKEMIRLTEKFDNGGAAGSSESIAEGADACCATGDTRTTLAGGNNREKIWNYLVGELKLNDTQAAGIMGNMQQESNFSPTALNPGSGAYGIVQWYAGRKTALENYAREQNKSKSDLGVQLAFLKKELEGSYKSSVYDPIKNSKTLAEATRIWLEKFEIPCTPGAGCDAEMNKRLPMSQNWLNKYGEGRADSSTSAENFSGCPSSGGGTTGELAWPLPKQYPVVSCYGTQARGRLHSGLDIAAPRGAPVKAADGGEVVEAYNGDLGGFGNTVIIKHSDELFTLYAHLKDGSLRVQKGDTVSQGQKIAEVNNTGHSFGDHLHFNVQTVGNSGVTVDNTKDPLGVLPKDGRSISGGDCK